MTPERAAVVRRLLEERYGPLRDLDLERAAPLPRPTERELVQRRRAVLLSIDDDPAGVVRHLEVVA